MSTPLHVLHVISGLWQHTGGPSAMIPELCAAQVKAGCAVTLATLDGPMAETVHACARAGVQVYRFRPNMHHSIWYSRELGQQLPSLAQSADVVHVHGLWEYPMWMGCWTARHLGKPFIISPHGSLGQTAVKRSRWKKLLAGALCDNANLRAATCLQGSSESDVKAFRTYGLTNPVAVIPNAVDLSSLTTTSSAERFYNRFPQCLGKRCLLFMSRMHPTKGLLDLAEAWAAVASSHPEWHLVVVGPDSQGYAQKFLTALERAGVGDRATYTGPLYGIDRIAAYRTADLFVLPTHSENFGIVIIEALACGLPVVTTHGAPWKEVPAHGCGWWVPIGAPALSMAFHEALALPKQALIEMGMRGQNWVKSAFTWDRVTGEFLTVYRWVLGRGERPDCVCMS